MVRRCTGEKCKCVQHLKAKRYYFSDYLSWFSLPMIASCGSFCFCTPHRTLECVGGVLYTVTVDLTAL
jgi:hypothetical protein